MAKKGEFGVDGVRVATLRERARLTQAELAERCGLSLRTVSSVENGAAVSVRTLLSLADALGVAPAEDLLAERGTSGDPPAVSPGAGTERGAATEGAAASGRGPHLVPPPPSLLVGREPAIRRLRARLASPTDAPPARARSLTAIRGWPGVGKSSVALALAHDADIGRAYPDGVLWVSLGPRPEVLAGLATWARALGGAEPAPGESARGFSLRIASLLRGRSMLLVVDDVWEVEHFLPFDVGGRACATLLTTRDRGIADELAQRPGDVCEIACLDESDSLELLATLAPDVVPEHAEESRALAREVEGLPLALQVAGRMLRAEAARGWGVRDLLAELRDAARLLREKAPPGMTALMAQTTPTVAALLAKSTDRLAPGARERFAQLGAFASKPATFDLEAMAAVWAAERPEDAKATVDELIDRGLMEPVVPGRFWIHALLASHARSLCEE